MKQWSFDVRSWGQARPPLEEGNERLEGMGEPRNARPQKALVGRAQWKINQPPSPKK